MGIVVTFAIYYRIVSSPVLTSLFRLTAALSVVTAMGCSDTAPARIVVAADTLVVNTTIVEPLDVHVVNRQGAVVQRVPIQYSITAPDSILVIRDGNRIQCRSDGVARVMLTAGRLKTSATVRCDIIEKIIAEGLVCTRMGDPPLRLSVAAFDNSGNAIANPRLYVISDSSLVRIANGFITPLKAGDGDIDYTNGRHRTVTLIRILDRASVVDSSSPRSKSRNAMFRPVCAQLQARRP